MKCINCRKSFKHTRVGQSVCCYECAIEYTRKSKEKALRQSLKTQKQKVQEARTVFQGYIRKRDASLPCISCGATSAKQWHAGHYLKAELYSGLIFDETNCHKQCSKCNVFMDGNELNYRLGLINRYGDDYVLALEEKKQRSKAHKYSDEELEEIKQKYKKKTKEI